MLPLTVLGGNISKRLPAAFSLDSQLLSMLAVVVLGVWDANLLGKAPGALILAEPT
jgi:hypothetical protein